MDGQISFTSVVYKPVGNGECQFAATSVVGPKINPMGNQIKKQKYLTKQGWREGWSRRHHCIFETAGMVSRLWSTNLWWTTRLW